MNKHFTITINDDNGVYQLNLHQFVKKALIYTFMFLVFIALSAVGTILYLDYSVDKIEKKRLDIQSAYEELQTKNYNLDESVKTNQHLLDVKKQELDEVSESLSEIEAMIGIASEPETPLVERITETKITSQNMATLLQFLPNGSPIEYKGITSKFGNRIHPTLNIKEFHPGTDLRAEMNTPIYATADGVVNFAGMHKRSGYGNLIIIQHGYGFRTYFGHLNKIVIKSGQFIKKGDLLGYTGTTGMSNGPHLHYEVRFLSRVVNPYWFLKWSAKNYYEIFEKENKIPWQSLIKATANIKVQKPTQTQPLLQQALLSRAK
jgi:murein DD-endopeptidase MepM/ murein hydrolase activator NlpD